MEKTVEIVAAHPLEVMQLRKKLESKPFKRTTHGSFLLGDASIEIVLCGVGAEKVKTTLSLFSEKDKMCSLILNIGFAGALDPELVWGDWIICNQICHFDVDFYKDKFFIPPPDLLREAQEYFLSKRISFQTGSLVTVDEACTSAERRERLFREAKAVAVDMEAYYIAKFAFEKYIPCLFVKIISDEMLDLAEDAIKSKGRILSRRIAETIPDFIIRLVSLDENKSNNPYTQ